MPILLPDQLDIPASFDDVAKAGSMLGSAGIIVMDETTCMVWAARNLLYFYKHESCGKCTPCREGTGWLLRLLTRLEEGQGTEKDVEMVLKVSHSIEGKTVCPFGDAAIAPSQSNIAKFREEFEYHVREKRCWRQVAKTFEEARALQPAGGAR